MKKLLSYVVFSILIGGFISSCDDTTNNIGNSLTSHNDLITVTDGVFKLSSRSVVVDSVLSRNILGYLGNVKDPETGAYINSNFITQFHTFEDFSLPDKSILSKGIVADSCEVRLFYNSFYGDSLTAMRATLYELDKPVEENQNYYSSFNPEKEGFIRKADGCVKISKNYTLADGNYTDSVRQTSDYVNNISFHLNKPYTDKNGKTYNNYGTYIMEKYYENPSNFKNSYNFIHNVCPGFYIKSENGLGSMAYIYVSQLNTYFTYKDSTEHVGVLNFTGTEEVRQLTQVYNDKERIAELAADNTCTYLKSPAGIFTELTIPVEDICRNHENDSINSAKVVLQCINECSGDNDYSFNVPTTILMVRAGEAKEFFEKNKIADSRTSFVSSYSSSSNTYTFSNIGELIKTMFKGLPEDPATKAQYIAANPEWNKVLIIPVNATYTTYNSSSVLSKLTHEMSLSSTRLIGGSENPYNDIEISIIFSKMAK